MNAYRIALILCRAVVVALWWSAGVHFVSAAVMIIAALFGVFGRGIPVTPLSLQSLIDVVPTVIAAGFLQIFAASLAASMTGGGAFEGDSIASRRTLEAPERALGNAGGGLFLLFFGAANAIPAMFSGVYMALFGGLGRGTTAAFTTYSLVNSALPALLQCIVGFVLAFSLGLRRVVKPG